jgi:putative sigma-54 modulation protein
MRIEIRKRNVAVGPDLKDQIEKRFAKIAKQVPPDALLEVELIEEKNPKLAKASQVAEATLHLKGTVLRGREASPSITQSINKVADELARQVKRHREKRSGRRESAKLKAAPPAFEPGPAEQPASP